MLHSFSGDLKVGLRAVSSQFCLGVTGPVTFKKADILRQVATDLPVQNLLIETDAPFLTPHPHRGERTEPAFVRFVAEKIAALRNLEPDRFEQITTESAERLFRGKNFVAINDEIVKEKKSGKEKGEGRKSEVGKEKDKEKGNGNNGKGKGKK